MSKKAVRNVFGSVGAYCLSSWLEMPVVLAFAPITNRLRFTGDFEGMVVMPIVLGIPSALVMALTGAVVNAHLELTPFRSLRIDPPGSEDGRFVKGGLCL